jgi:predicted Zn-dependent peptidase
MLFSGTKHLPQQSLKFLESVGASAGRMANGFTNFDHTNYFEVVPSAELPAALWVESERMGFLLEALNDQALTVQRDVVSNERRQNYENSPYGTARLRTCNLLYPQPHPYFDCVIGNIEEVQSARLEDVRSFFQAFYGPGNASLAIVGDFDAKVAKALVEQYFGPIPSRAAPPALVELPTTLTTEVRERIEDNVAEVPRLRLVWPGVKPYAPDEAPGDVVARVLGSGGASRLYRELVLEKQVASRVSASDDVNELGGAFTVDITASRGHSVDELLALTQPIIDDLKRGGITADELKRAQLNIAADMLRGLEGLAAFGGRADLLNRYQIFTGDPGYLPRDLAQYRAVTAASAQAFAVTYLRDDRRLVLDIEPRSRPGKRAAQ